jgi:hypothetical protein
MNRRQELLRCAEQNVGSTASRSDGWIDRELAECKFNDVRHGKRFRKLLQQLSDGVGGSIPWICQDWANTKAAYRFFSNDRVSEEEILAGHFQSTRERFAAHHEPVLILHDTTEFVYHRDAFAAVGVLTDSNLLGLTAIKFWTRDKFHGCSALKKKVNPTRVPIEKKESIRWLENLRQS